MSLENLFSAVICDALDSMGYRHQALTTQFHHYTGITRITGRCKTTLWTDMYHKDENPYELELKAVDSCQPGEILICAAGGSVRSGIWGELLTTAAINSGCKGVIVHGCIRDIEKMRAMNFPVFATGKSPYDSQNRQRVVDIDINVKIDDVVCKPGDLVFGDEDGIVVIPREIEEDVIKKAYDKVNAENISRNAIKGGMKASEAYKKYGVL